MSEKEKKNASSILEVLNKLAEARGEEYANGLVDGINIGTAKAEKAGDGSEEEAVRLGAG